MTVEKIHEFNGLAVRHLPQAHDEEAYTPYLECALQAEDFFVDGVHLTKTGLAGRVLPRFRKAILRAVRMPSSPLAEGTSPCTVGAGQHLKDFTGPELFSVAFVGLFSLAQHSRHAAKYLLTPLHPHA